MGQRAEDLRGWLRGETRKEKTVMHRWEKVVRLIQLEFVERELPEEITWETMVLLLKGKGGYRGIRMVEV